MAGQDKTYTVLQAVELPPDDDIDQYQMVPDEVPETVSEIDQIDDLDRLAKEVQPEKQAEPGAIVGERATVADDFIQNFFLQCGLTKSLEAFQNEWYQKKANGELAVEDTEVVRDLHFKNQQMYEECKKLEGDLSVAKEVAKKSIESLDNFRKERDFHRANYHKVVEEKEGLLEDLKKLHCHYENYEPTLVEMKHKYEVVMKEKMLLRMERDKILKKIQDLQPPRNKTSEEHKKSTSKPSTTSTSRTAHTSGSQNAHDKSSSPLRHGKTPWPDDDTPNPHLTASYDAVKPNDFRISRTLAKAHDGGISRLKFHPKSALCTVGDDHVWKMWSLSSMGELIIAGTGHHDFVSGLDIHPKNENIVITSAGDGAVKLWDIAQEKCTYTVHDHKRTAWNVVFHDSGDFFATCSEDHSARIYDFNAIAAGKGKQACRTVLQGHTDGINHISFEAFSNICVTASQDKTVSLWDMRTGHCTATLYGHEGSVNHATFSLQNNMLSTCDLNGMVKLWDPRLLKEKVNVSLGDHAANASAFDRTGKTLAIACGDGSIKMIDTQEEKLVISIEAHDDQVLDVAFDPNGKFLATSSSDGTVKLWQEK